MNLILLTYKQAMSREEFTSQRSTGLPRITRGIISIHTLQTGDLFLASGSEPTINVSGEAGHKIDCWLAIARQEKIVSLKIINGYNPSRNTRETCTPFHFLIPGIVTIHAYTLFTPTVHIILNSNHCNS